MLPKNYVFPYTIRMTETTLPARFIEKLPSFLSDEQISLCLHGCMMTKKPSFRVNTLKTTRQALEQDLTAQGFILTHVSWYEDAFVLENKSIRELTATGAYKQGFFYIQNLSSMIPPLILDPKPHEKILDLAAAPGSKTTQIAVLMQNTGEIVANDSSYTRLFHLKRNLQEQRVTNTKVICLQGQKIWEQIPDYFDKTLVDVPCSMEGRFQTSDPKSYADWTPKKGKMLAPKQGYMLRSAISATKPGGTIVYSTCTISPEENEGVIDWILKKEKDRIAIEKITFPHIPSIPAVTVNGVKKYDMQVLNCLRILPSETTEGFFVAKIKRNY